MASAEEADAAAAGDEGTYPLVDGELEQEINTDFPVHDTVNVPPSQNLKKEKAEAERKENKDGMQNLKSTLLLSGAVVAVIGVIFALVQKIKKP